MTQAHLVVLATGRVRPVATPVKVFNIVRGEVLSASPGGRVVEVGVRQGDVVRRGDVLIRLETERLDNEIAKQRRTIHAGEEELARLSHLEELASRQFDVARSRAEAELEQVQREVRRASELRDAEVRLAEVALRTAEVEEASLRRLVERRVAAPTELFKAATETHRARASLTKARIPVDEGRVAVLRRSLDGVERDYAIKREELTLRREAKKAEVEAARLELANRELERGHAILRAPIDGVATAGDVKVGDLLEAGKPVVEIARQEGFHFEAEVPSEAVARLRVGIPARILLDAFDYQRYGALEGMVCFISPDSGMADGRRTATYTVKIALHQVEFGREAPRGRVKLGMTGRVEIVTGRESLLSLLLKRIRQTISLG
jgi:multidrug resistance efflux pump